MAKMYELLESWLESDECPIADNTDKLASGEYYDGQTTATPESVTADVVENFRAYCDGCAAGVLPAGAVEGTMNAYKDYLDAMNKPNNHSLGGNEWYWCIIEDDSANIEIPETWEEA